MIVDALLELDEDDDSHETQQIRRRISTIRTDESRETS